MCNFNLLFIIILIIYILYCIFGKNHKRYVGCGSNCKGNCNKVNNAKQIESLDIIFIKMEGCIHCVHLKELLDENDISDFVTIIDSNSSKVDELQKMYGKINGYPTMISKNTGKVMIGGRSSIKDIIAELS